MKNIVIVGNGIAGITTARHIRKRTDDPITVISSESKHFYSRTALMYIYMGHMTHEHTKPYEDWFWQKNRIDLVLDYVTGVDTDNKQLTLKNGQPVPYDVLVLATGSKSNYFGWPGQDLEGVQGLYNLGDLERMERNTREVTKAVIVGGGLIGIEMAEMLRTRDIDVTFLVRESHYWGNILPKEEAQLVSRHASAHHVKFNFESELKAILPDDRGRVRAVETNKGETLTCQFVGLTAGVSPNIEWLKSTPVETDRGILVNECLETNVPDVYAVGDCAQICDKNGNRRLEQLWYTGRMQGEALAKTICGDRTAYRRGTWFNSAKFFDIEYQTYGFVANQPRETEACLYWEHPSGEKCLRLVYKKESHQFIGVNVFGIRLRHQVFKTWLEENRTVEYVLQHLREAHFDPEFFKRFEADILNQYNREHDTSLVLEKKKGLLSLFK